MTSPSNSRSNPFVGPRAFRYGEKLFGRDRDVRDLLDILISERIVLMYSPSGAGKTSLIQAGLVPELKKRKFNVIPPPDLQRGEAGDVLRVNQPLPGGLSGNRYLMSLLLTLERALPQEQQRPQELLAAARLAEYLAQYPVKSEGTFSNIIIIDQFEEILTLDPTDQEAKEEFFTQVGEALSDRNLWALFSMREDFVAGLDPFLRRVPTTFSNTFRLDLLGQKEARLAMQAPPKELHGVVFTDAAADRLLNDLSEVQVQAPDGSIKTRRGLYVEPVQLQVVCSRIWEMIGSEDMEIGADDVERVGDVNKALSDFYGAKVAAVAADTGASERQIRQWFDTSLITEQGIRGQVLHSAGESGGLSNEAIALLVDAHLVRADKRRNFVWYELAHDRLIMPVRANNAEWFKTHLSVLQRQAQLWDSNHQDSGILLKGTALAEAEQWAKESPGEINQTERDFLTACLAARAQEQKEMTANRRLKIVFSVTIVVCLLLIGFGFMLLHQMELAKTNELKAQAEKLKAQEQKIVADTERDKSKALTVRADALALLANLRAQEAQREKEEAKRQKEEAKRQRDEADRQKEEADRQRDHAEMLARIALSRQLAAKGTSLISDQPDRALLYSLEANRVPNAAAARPEAEGALLTVLSRSPRIEQFIHGHQAPVRTVAYSPDGKMIASAGQDNQIMLWNSENGHLLGRALKGHESWIRSVAFSPNGGRFLASASSDGTVGIWDTETSKGARTRAKDEAGDGNSDYEVVGVVFDPSEENRVISACSDGGMSAWKLDPKTLKLEKQSTIFDGQREVNSLTIDRSGTLIAAVGNDSETSGYFTIWDARTGKRLGTRTTHDDVIWHAAFSPDGKKLATGGADYNIKIWNIADPAQPHLEKRPLTGHTNTVTSLAFSPDGRTLLSGSGDHTVRLWDVETGSAKGTQWSGHANAVYSVAFSSNGHQAVSAGMDHNLIVWKTDTTLSNRLGEEKGIVHFPVWRVAMRPDGRLVATGGSDGSIMLWNPLSRLPVMPPLNGHTYGVSGLTFSRDGKTLISAGLDQTIRFWNPETGEPLAPPLTGQHEKPVRAIALDPGRATLASAGDDGSIVIWDLKGSKAAKKVAPAHRGRIISLAYNPEGSVLASGGESGEIRLWQWDGSNLAPLGPELAGHKELVVSLAFSPDGKILASGDQDGSVLFWEGIGEEKPRRRLFKELAPAGEVNTLVFSPDSPTILAGGVASPPRVWDIRTGEAVTGNTLTGPATAAAGSFNAEGTLLAVADGDGSMWLWNKGSGKTDFLEGGHEAAVTTLALAGDGKWLAYGMWDGSISLLRFGPGLAEPHPLTSENAFPVTGLTFTPGKNALVSSSWYDQAGSAKVWDGGQGWESAGNTAGSLEKAQSIGYSRDGSKQARAVEDGTVTVLDAAGKARWSSPAHPVVAPDKPQDHMIHLAFHPKKEVLATARKNTIKIWGAATGELLAQVEVSEDEKLRSIAFSPDGSLFAAAGKEMVIRLWHCSDLNQMKRPASMTLVGHGGAVLSLAFSPDSRILASGSQDRTVRLWDTGTGKKLGMPLLRHAQPVQALVFDPHRRTLYSAGRDGRIIEWELEFDQLRKKACRIAGRSLLGEERSEIQASKGRVPVCLEAELYQADRLALEARGENELNKAQARFREIVDTVLDPKGEYVSDYDIKNIVCWEGAQNGARFAEAVMTSCDRAVAEAPESIKPFLRDTRGVARAQVGRYREAVEDFEAFLSWAVTVPSIDDDLKSKRLEWIDALKEKRNPFDEAGRRELRAE